MAEKRVWGIHSMNDYLFLDRDVIAIGWKAMGDLGLLSSNRDAFKKQFVLVYPDAKPQSVANSVGMLYRFIYEAKVGDYVVFPSKINREINIGVIEGEYRYSPDGSEWVHTRQVKWLRHLPRTAFSQGALYEVGSALTFFSIKNYADEYLAALENKKTEIVTDDAELVEKTANDIIESTKDYILKTLSRYLKGYDLENFVADLLHAMGYYATVSPHGGDSGIDITAYKDELPPRILVQVKSGVDDIKESTIQSLKGAMREGDYGLFITLANYTKNAKAYLLNTPIIRGINGTELVELILKYYDGLSDTYKQMIPLQRVYIPNLKAES
ncbi:MAG: restriction endonuclease [Clostridia bacterium]|nr:restriction endonuclease [Clostridia bacterium]